MIKPSIVVIAAVAILLLGGCSPDERREMREHEARVAAEQAKQQRLAAQYTADVVAETRRRKNVLAAETSRQSNRQIASVAKVLASLSAIGGVIAFAVFSFRRLGERIAEEHTVRHGLNLKAIVADPHLSSAHRQQLYRNAIQNSRRGGPPLLGPPRDEGDD